MTSSTAFSETVHNYVPLAGRDTGNSRAMASDSDRRRVALRAFIKNHELQVKPWAKKAGVAAGVVFNFLNRRSESLNATTLEKLARAADATVAEIIGEKPRDARSAKDIATIRGLAIQAAMGGGIQVAEETEGEPFYFRRSWVEQFAGPRALLRVIELKGDSMEPTLHDRDVALVLVGSRTPINDPGGVYVLWDGNGLIVKRLQVIPAARPKLRILSDNPLYPPYEIDLEDAQIVGRVIWRGGEL